MLYDGCCFIWGWDRRLSPKQQWLERFHPALPKRDEGPNKLKWCKINIPLYGASISVTEQSNSTINAASFLKAQGWIIKTRISTTSGYSTATGVFAEIDQHSGGLSWDLNQLPESTQLLALIEGVVDIQSADKGAIMKNWGDLRCLQTDCPTKWKFNSKKSLKIITQKADFISSPFSVSEGSEHWWRHETMRQIQPQPKENPRLI